MSFEKKLYDYEVIPPVTVWDKLSIALDDLQFEDHFKKKLEAATTQPSVNVWEKIEKNLSSEIADTAPLKLYNITETPPADLWSKIDEQLAEDDFSKKFSERLATLEVTPPVGNWRKIATSIRSETPVISFAKKYSKPLRYAAAAIVIGLIALAGITFFNSKNSSIAGIETNKKIEPPSLDNNTKQNQANDLQPNTSTISSTPIEITDALPKKQEKRSVPKLAKNEPLLAGATNATLDSHSGSEEIIADANFLQSNKKAEITNSGDDSPRYLVYLNDKGSLMKVSKKLADLTCIYTKDGEVSQNTLAKLDRVICNDVVLCWQEKLALAPRNFSFNPLEMADILK